MMIPVRLPVFPLSWLFIVFQGSRLAVCQSCLLTSEVICTRLYLSFTLLLSIMLSILSTFQGFQAGTQCWNVPTTPLRQWGFRQCLPFTWTTLRGKHCRYPIAGMGVVDTLGQYLLSMHNGTAFHKRSTYW